MIIECRPNSIGHSASASQQNVNKRRKKALSNAFKNMATRKRWHPHTSPGRPMQLQFVFSQSADSEWKTVFAPKKSGEGELRARREPEPTWQCQSLKKCNFVERPFAGVHSHGAAVRKSMWLRCRNPKRGQPERGVQKSVARGRVQFSFALPVAVGPRLRVFNPKKGVAGIARSVALENRTHTRTRAHEHTRNSPSSSCDFLKILYIFFTDPFLLSFFVCQKIYCHTRAKRTGIRELFSCPAFFSRTCIRVFVYLYTYLLLFLCWACA